MSHWFDGAFPDPMPEYRVKTSPRARHVRLKVKPGEGLWVVIPRGFDRRRVPALVADKRDWIERALRRVGEPRAAVAPDFLPDTLDLTAIGERWEITYRAAGQRLRLDEEPAEGRLVLAVNQPRQDRVFHRIRCWLRERAKRILEPMARDMAHELNLELGRVSIRNQQARWGSCSSSGNVSLNLKLLFVSPDQLRYVLLHELCHIEHLNHSPAFWTLVSDHDPEFGKVRLSMRSAWRRVPAWV
jgi:predicted metal-dependent hydrolase